MRRFRVFQGDPVVWAILFIFLFISLIEVYSAASTLSYRTGSFLVPLIQHGRHLLLGLLCAWVVHNIPCRYFKVLPIILVPLVLVLLVLTPWIGVTLNEGGRWIDLGVRFQPSELAKGTLVLTVALLLSQMKDDDESKKNIFKWVLGLSIVICGLIFTENLSTAVILFFVILAMMTIGGIPGKYLVRLFAVLAVAGTLFLLLLYFLPRDPKAPIYDVKYLERIPTWQSRIFGGGEEKFPADPKDFDMKNNAQVGHAHIAIAASHGYGRFLGNSVQRDFLSQAYSDFIFAIIVEESGLFGAFFVILLYIILLFRTGRIAGRCKHKFPAYLAMGLALLLAFQAMVNMMVATGLFPVTGQPLPFISRGGTSTIVSYTYAGVILSISRYARRREPEDTAQETEELPALSKEDEEIEKAFQAAD